MPRPRLPLALVAAFGALGGGCVADVSSGEAHRLVAEGARLVDVRDRDEYTGGHLPGARNVPLGEIEAHLDAVGPPAGPVVVYCHSGVRAFLAARTLRRAGYTKVHRLATMSRWNRDPSSDVSLF